MPRQKLLGPVLAAGFAVAGCTAPPSPDALPQPMPFAAPSRSPITEACGDLAATQIIFQDRRGVQTARNKGDCVAVYEPFNRQRIGTIAIESVFGILCVGPEPSSRVVLYGKNYENTGGIYLTPKLQSAYESDILTGYQEPIRSCDQWPHAPFVSK